MIEAIVCALLAAVVAYHVGHTRGRVMGWRDAAERYEEQIAHADYEARIETDDR